MTQDEALTILTLGKNTLLTGAPGSGKSYVLRRYIVWLREHGIEPTIIAPTGIAASHIDGVTVHAWAGVGRHAQVSAYDIDRIASTERVVLRMRAMRVLIVDEVSMLSGGLLKTIEEIVRSVLQRDDVFAGCQVVLCGDFFQLPPFATVGNVSRAFESSVWRALDLSVCYLTEQHRVQHDGLMYVLNAIRSGTGLDEARDLLMSRVGRSTPQTVLALYPHNSDVDRINVERLALMPGDSVTYTARVLPARAHRDGMDRESGIPESVTLKRSAEVIFTKNDPERLYVNGTQGVVHSFVHGQPEVSTRAGVLVRVRAVSWQHPSRIGSQVQQLPLRLAWALTIHKSQGMTLDAARMDLSRAFVPEQGYVALSRVRTLDALYLDGFNDTILTTDARLRALDVRWQQQAKVIQHRLQSTSRMRISELQSQHVYRCIEPQTVGVKGVQSHGTSSVRVTVDALSEIAHAFTETGSWSTVRVKKHLQGKYTSAEIDAARVLLGAHIPSGAHTAAHAESTRPLPEKKKYYRTT